MPEITYIDDENIFQIVRIRNEAMEYIVHAMSTPAIFCSRQSAHISLQLV